MIKKVNLRALLHGEEIDITVAMYTKKSLWFVHDTVPYNLEISITNGILEILEEDKPLLKEYLLSNPEPLTPFYFVEYLTSLEVGSEEFNDAVTVPNKYKVLVVIEKLLKKEEDPLLISKYVQAHTKIKISYETHTHLRRLMEESPEASLLVSSGDRSYFSNDITDEDLVRVFLLLINKGIEIPYLVKSRNFYLMEIKDEETCGVNINIYFKGKEIKFKSRDFAYELSRLIVFERHFIGPSDGVKFIGKGEVVNCYNESLIISLLVVIDFKSYNVLITDTTAPYESITAI